MCSPRAALLAACALFSRADEKVALGGNATAVWIASPRSGAVLRGAPPPLRLLSVACLALTERSLRPLATGLDVELEFGLRLGARASADARPAEALEVCIAWRCFDSCGADGEGEPDGERFESRCFGVTLESGGGAAGSGDGAAAAAPLQSGAVISCARSAHGVPVQCPWAF